MLNKSTLPVLLFFVVFVVLIVLYRGSSTTGMQIFTGLCPCLNDIDVNQPKSEIEQDIAECVFGCLNEMGNTTHEDYTEYEGGDTGEDEEVLQEYEEEEEEKPNEKQFTVKKGERVATANTNRIQGDKNTKHADKKLIADTPTNAKGGTEGNKN